MMMSVGGYAFHETSSSTSRQAESAVMESTMQTPTGAEGKLKLSVCLSSFNFG